MKVYILIILLFMSNLSTSLFAGSTALREEFENKELMLLRTKKSKPQVSEANEWFECVDDSLITSSTNQSGASDLDYAIFEDTVLVLPYLRWMRNEFIEKVATPNFFSISYMARPLNIFIFPIFHSLPLTVIPPYIRSMIYAIASAKNSILYTEILDDDDSDDEDIENIFQKRDPREQLNIEKAIKRELAYYTSNFRNIYVQDEKNPLQLRDWDKARERKENELRDIFEKGWTRCLSDEAKEMLLEIDADALDQLNSMDPLCFYYTITNMTSEEFRPFIYGLDSEIEDLFSEMPREIRGLEREKDRDDAFDQELWSGTESYDDEYFISLATIISLSNENIGKLIRNWRLQELMEVNDCIYYPHLDAINLSEPMVYSYMLGQPLKVREHAAVNVRNDMWWKDTICPLLEERSRQGQASDMQNMAPILLKYGAAHNAGSASILDQIRKLNGFEIYLLTRKGFRKE